SRPRTPRPAPAPAPRTTPHPRGRARPPARTDPPEPSTMLTPGVARDITARASTLPRAVNQAGVFEPGVPQMDIETPCPRRVSEPSVCSPAARHVDCRRTEGRLDGRLLSSLLRARRAPTPPDVAVGMAASAGQSDGDTRRFGVSCDGRLRPSPRGPRGPFFRAGRQPDGGGGIHRHRRGG